MGYGLGSDALDIAVGALLLFLTNLAAIVFVSVLIFLLLGFSPRDRAKQPQVRTAVGLNMLVLALLSVPLGISSCHTNREANLERAVVEVLQRRADLRSLTLRNVVVTRQAGEFVVTAGVFADTLPTQDEVTSLRDEVASGTGLPVRLDLLMVRATRLSSGPAEDPGLDAFLDPFIPPEDPVFRGDLPGASQDGDAVPGQPPPEFDEPTAPPGAGDPAAPAGQADPTDPAAEPSVPAGEPVDEPTDAELRDAQVDAFEQGFDAPAVEPLLDAVEEAEEAEVLAEERGDESLDDDLGVTPPTEEPPAGSTGEATDEGPTGGG